MNLDPDNATFWTGDDETGEVYHVDISTGDVISSFNSDPPVGLYGLTLVGSINVSQPTVTLSPETQTDNTGQTASVTATITNPGGSISGQTVDFSVTGMNPQSGARKTNASGKTTFSYTGTNPGQDLVTATYRSADGTATVVWQAGSCDSGPWPSELNHVPTVMPGEPRGFYIGVKSKSGQWILEVTHFHHPPTPGKIVDFTGTITTDGRFTGVNAIMLESGDHYSLSSNQETLTFAFQDHGWIDGVSFTPKCGSTMTLNLSIEGVPASTTRIHLGVPPSSPATNPVTFTRTS
jgi:hypothetical protein